MIDEVNRLKLAKRYEQHGAGIKMGKLMLINNQKPYTYRPLKTKGWPSDIHVYDTPNGKACEWPPKQKRGEPVPREIMNSPFVDITYRCYLEQRGRFMRHGELPHDSSAVSKYQCGVFLSEDREISPDMLLRRMHAEEIRKYVPPPYRMTVYS